MDLIEQLYRTGRTVFSIQDLRVLWKESRSDALRAKVKYYVRTGRLKSLKRGVYAFAEEYNPFELAQIMITPSYISLESALRYHALLFQFNTTMTCVAGYTRTIAVDGRRFEYHKIRHDILAAPLGIERKEHYMIASPERAYCDAVYLGYVQVVEQFYAWDRTLLNALMALYDVPRVSRAIASLQV